MEIYDYLDTHGIEYERHDHPPVFTCEDVKQLCPPMAGTHSRY